MFIPVLLFRNGRFSSLSFWRREDILAIPQLRCKGSPARFLATLDSRTPLLNVRLSNHERVPPRRASRWRMPKYWAAVRSILLWDENRGSGAVAFGDDPDFWTVLL